MTCVTAPEKSGAFFWSATVEIKGKLFTTFRQSLIYGLNKEILDEFGY